MIEPKAWTTIVVPCFNESARLRSFEFAQFLESCQAVRFLFVNDGSKDQTLAVLTTLQQGREQRVQILNLVQNQGKGEAVRLGMLNAIQDTTVRYVGFWDADLATPLDAIPALVRELELAGHLNMVFGSRIRLLGREVHRKAARHYLGRVFASVVSIVLGLPIYDTQCGAKIFRVTPDLSRILAKPFLSRWVFDVEILARSIQLHAGDVDHLHRSVYEFPLQQWRDVSGSKVRPKDFLRAMIDVVKIKRSYL